MSHNVAHSTERGGGVDLRRIGYGRSPVRTAVQLKPKGGEQEVNAEGVLA